jgi:hypothetical protein
VTGPAAAHIGAPCLQEVETSRRRLVASLTAAQAVLADVAHRAAEHDALLDRHHLRGAGDELAVDADVLTAWVAYEAAALRSPRSRLALHLRYFAGRRFLVDRPDGLLAGVAQGGDPPRVAGQPP